MGLALLFDFLNQVLRAHFQSMVLANVPKGHGQGI